MSQQELVVKASLNLNEVLKKRNRSLINVTDSIGKSYSHILKQVRGERESIDYDLIARLCVELKCTPNDIILLEPKDWKERLKVKGEKTNDGETKARSSGGLRGSQADEEAE